MKKAVLALSGGIDSATVLRWLLKNNYDVKCLNFLYPSKHNQYEMDASHKVFEYYRQMCPERDMEYKKISCSFFSEMKSHLLSDGGDIPEGHYTDQTMSKTVVPARNMIFLSIMAGIAESEQAEMIALGIHQGDHAIYPDCRPEFYKSMDLSIYLATDEKVQTYAPFLYHTKADVVGWGIRNNVPHKYTRTCYKDQPKPCGKCSACIERLEAFAQNSWTDPVEYDNLP